MMFVKTLLGIGVGSVFSGLPLVLGAPLDPVDPCDKLAGKTHAAPMDVLACYKSWPFNETIRQNVLTTVGRVFDFFTFENHHLDPPAPFQASKADIRAIIAKINETEYETDYDFQKAVLDFTLQLNDGHTRYVPTCYNAYQSVLPTPVTSLYDPETGEHAIHIAPNAVELMTLMGTTYTDYFDELGFDWKSLAGAKVLSIDNMDPYDYVDKVADTISGNYLDHNIRVNQVFTSYRIAGEEWSQRVGDLAGPIQATRPDLPMTLIRVNATEPEDVRIPFFGLHIGLKFEDRADYWRVNCEADSSTNGVDFKEFFPPPDGRSSGPAPPRRHMKGDFIDPSKHSSLALPDGNLPTLPQLEGSRFVIKAYLLPDGETGVLYVGSFLGNFDQFQLDVSLAIGDLKAKGATRLLIDLSNNGGGYICLGHYLYAYLAATDEYSMFTSTSRAHYMSQQIVKGGIRYKFNKDWSYYASDNWSFVNGTQMPVLTDYLDPPLNVTVNGREDFTSQKFQDRCSEYFVVRRPETPPFDLNKIAIFSNGACGSTCALFSTAMRERHGTKVVVVGGKPGTPMEWRGMAGNQVLEWRDIDTEMKTSGAKPDPLAPPDFIVKANFRHNWRTAYSTLGNNEVLAFKSDPADYRFYYTKDTFSHPQKLWIEASKLVFQD